MFGVWGLCPLPRGHQCSCLPGAGAMQQLRNVPAQALFWPLTGAGSSLPSVGDSGWGFCRGLPLAALLPL